MDPNGNPEKYIDWCKEGRAIPRLKGYEPFRILFEKGRIIPMRSAIRLMYIGIYDKTYYVNSEGLLIEEEDLFEENPQAYNPEEVLSIEANPDGWDLENY